MIKEFNVTAVYNKKQSCYYHFGIHEKTASLFGNSPESICKLKMRIVDNQERPDSIESDLGYYWGWFDNNTQKFSSTMIFNKLFLLELCFPDMRASERSGSGKAYRLEIVK